MERRLSDHSKGFNRSTKGKGPWEIVYTEAASNEASARARERQIKSYKGGEAFRRLVQSNHGEVA